MIVGILNLEKNTENGQSVPRIIGVLYQFNIQFLKRILKKLHHFESEVKRSSFLELFVEINTWTASLMFEP